MATVLGGVDDMPQRLWDCDLAIVNGGYSKLEAALLGTPAVMISAQWHQLPLAHCFSQQSGIPDLGYMSYVTVRALQEAIEALGSQEAREAQARQSRTTVDGRGFERVFEAIFGDAAENSA